MYIENEALLNLYVRPILQVNFLLEDEQTQLRNLEEAMDFYRNPRCWRWTGNGLILRGLQRSSTTMSTAATSSAIPGEIANCVEGFRRVHGIDKRRRLNYNKAQTM